MKKDIAKIALKNTKIYLVILVILSVGISYLTFLISMNIKYSIDSILFNNYNDIPQYLNIIFNQNYIHDLLIMASIIVLLNLLEKLLNYFRDRVTTKFKLKININLKETLYKHMLNLEYESYNSYDKTEIIQRINEDADVYSNFFNNQLKVILDIIFLSIFIMREGIELNLEILIYIFFSIIIMLLFSLWYLKKVDIIIENKICKRKKLLKATINNINYFKFIRIFNKQEEEKQKYKILNDNCYKEEAKFIKLVLFYDIVLEHLTYLKTPIIYMIGGIAIINGKMTMGALVALHNLAEKIFDCIYTFGDNLDSIDNFKVVTKKINKLLQLKEENNDNHLYDLNGEIIFSNVSIYIDNQNILKDINFMIKQGQNVAIIGENGSGKSILAKTILGFYKYEGNIYINNHNIKRLNKEDIRKYVELILGESYMFSGSILENIKLDNNIEISTLEKTLIDCDIKEDIDNFKEGYNTLIGEKGTKLSGGQKQRISIARGLIRGKPILILDEALNKLDNKTRKNILTSLVNNYKDKTIIFISNNLEIINYVDNIIYINKKTTTMGTHNELMVKNENYKEMIEINENII